MNFLIRLLCAQNPPRIIALRILEVILATLCDTVKPILGLIQISSNSICISVFICKVIVVHFLSWLWGLHNRLIITTNRRNMPLVTTHSHAFVIAVVVSVKLYKFPWYNSNVRSTSRLMMPVRLLLLHIIIAPLLTIQLLL